MEHADAIRTNAVERYLLGEMSEDEREVFERHYFDCRVCAADVTDGTRLMMAGRIVAAGEARPANVAQPANVVPMRPGRFRWVPAAAAAALIVGLGGLLSHRNTVSRPPVHTAAVGKLVRLETGQSRAGTAGEIPTVRPGDWLTFDVRPGDEPVSHFVAGVTCGGKEQLTKHISLAEAADDECKWRPGELPAGPCELVIEGVPKKGGNRFEITRSPFRVVDVER